MTAVKESIKIEPGIYKDMPFADYLAIDAFHKSIIKEFSRTPAHYLASLEDESETDDMLMGNLFETLLLEPEKFDSLFIERIKTYPSEKWSGRGANKICEMVEKPFNANSHTCQDWMKEQEAKGLQVVTAEQIEAAKIMRDNVLTRPDMAMRCKEGTPQVTMVWEDQDTGILCKGRIDNLLSWEIVDLKSTYDASLAKFQKTMEYQFYHCQSAMYTDGYKTLTGKELPFTFIVAESRKPYLPAMYGPDVPTVEAGRFIYKKIMKDWAFAKESNQWPGYPECREPISLHYSAFNRIYKDESPEVDF